ncbi:MAG: CPBP family glutamic-type intramembrane protease [Bacteroidota bacterium]
MFLIILFTGLLEEFTNLDLGDHKLEELLDESPVLFAVFGIILAPLLEEFFFRFFITYRFAFYFTLPFKIVQSAQNLSHFSKIRKVRKYWSIVFPYVFYLSVMVFGFVHITNFEEYESFLWIMPLLTLPQLVIGVFLGFTRIKYGLRWSILLHALHNGILLAPVLIFEV